jgi:hypothetical protein
MEELLEREAATDRHLEAGSNIVCHASTRELCHQALRFDEVITRPTRQVHLVGCVTGSEVLSRAYGQHTLGYDTNFSGKRGSFFHRV